MFSLSSIPFLSILLLAPLLVSIDTQTVESHFGGGGCRVKSSWNASQLPVYRPPLHYQLIRLLETFYARTHWPHCADVIGRIGNQGDCGSCWAFAASTTMSDRICILSQGKSKPMISPQDIIECTEKAKGCKKGGHPYDAWKEFEKRGFVTGSIDSSTTGCKPYLLSCKDSNPLCKLGKLRCVTKCTNDNYAVPYNEGLYFGQPGSSYWVKDLPMEQIQQEIINNGPVTSGCDWRVFNGPSNDEDIIVAPGNDEHDEHEVRIIGWGMSARGTSYWIVANSYGRDWKEGGTVKVAFGAALVGKEITFGMPKV